MIMWPKTLMLVQLSSFLWLMAGLAVGYLPFWELVSLMGITVALIWFTLDKQGMDPVPIDYALFSCANVIHFGAGWSYTWTGGSMAAVVLTAGMGFIIMSSAITEGRKMHTRE